MDDEDDDDGIFDEEFWVDCDAATWVLVALLTEATATSVCTGLITFPVQDEGVGVSLIAALGTTLERGLGTGCLVASIEETEASRPVDEAESVD